MCLNEFKYTLIGLGLVLPGAVALFTNLCRAANKDSKHERCQCQQQDFNDYIYGQKFRLFELVVNRDTWAPKILRMRFKTVLKYLYITSRGKIILCGGVVNPKDQRTPKVVIIHPNGKRLLTDFFSLFFIALSVEDVETIVKNADEDIADVETTEDAELNSNIFTCGAYEDSNVEATLDDSLLEEESDETDGIRAPRVLSFLRFHEASDYSRAASSGIKRLQSGLCNFNVHERDNETPVEETKEEASKPPEKSHLFKDHIVIVLESPIGEPLNSLILHVVYCLTSIRRYFDGDVLVLSERGSELSRYALRPL